MKLNSVLAAAVCAAVIAPAAVAQAPIIGRSVQAEELRAGGVALLAGVAAMPGRYDMVATVEVRNRESEPLMAWCAVKDEALMDIGTTWAETSVEARPGDRSEVRITIPGVRIDAPTGVYFVCRVMEGAEVILEADRAELTLTPTATSP